MSTSRFERGARITYDGGVTSEETIRDAVRDRNVSIQDDPDTAPDGVSTRSELRREAVFVGLTLLGMVTGLVTGWLVGPELLRWAGYTVAYVFGGWYGLKGAIETTHQSYREQNVVERRERLEQALNE